jgi:hypothetical protein
LAINAAVAREKARVVVAARGANAEAVVKRAAESMTVVFIVQVGEGSRSKGVIRLFGDGNILL